MKKPVLYQYQISPFCDKVRRAMHLKGVPYEVAEVPLILTAKFKAVSPTRKFPAVDFGGEIIVDSSAILAHLDRLVPVPALLPADPKARADALILEDWADESLYFYDIVMRSWPQNSALFLDDLLHAETGLKRTLLASVIPGMHKKLGNAQGLGRKAQADVTAELGKLYDALVVRLDGREWLAGDAISIADIAVRSMHFVIDRTIEGKRLTDARPALAAWAARVDRLTLA